MKTDFFVKLKNTINYFFWILVFGSALIGKVVIIVFGIQFAAYKIFQISESIMDTSKFSLLWACIGSTYIDIGLLIRFFYPHPEDGKYRSKFRYRKKFWACSCYTQRLPREKQWIKCCICNKELPITEELYYNPSSTEAFCYACRIKDDNYSKIIKIQQ